MKIFVRIALTVALLAGLAALWLHESDLAYAVSQQRPIVLGRYTLETATLLFVITPLLLAALFAVWKGKGSISRQGVFKIIAVALALLVTVIAADVALRLGERTLYVGSETSYHRAPNKVYRGVFHDRPEALFTYPDAKAGHPDVPFTLTTDARGFRNSQTLEQADLVVIGDSFAEGSGVSDQHPWPVLLGQHLGLVTCNLGMSGGNPVTYLDVLSRFGLALKPKVVLYLLYEGNDLRDENFVTTHSVDQPPQRQVSGMEKLFRTSPLRRLFKSMMVRLLSKPGSRRFANDPAVHNPRHRLYPVSWLPLRVPEGSSYGYVFDMKRLRQHFVTESSFRMTRACAATFRLMEEAFQLCQRNGIQCAVIYAPDKPHILIDEILKQVDARQLYAFMKLHTEHLSAPQELGADLKHGTEVRENVFREFCREKGMPFFSLTDILREKTVNGTPTYFTYDQHWTPEGHKVVADFLAKELAPLLRASSLKRDLNAGPPAHETPSEPVKAATASTEETEPPRVNP